MNKISKLLLLVAVSMLVTATQSSLQAQAWKKKQQQSGGGGSTSNPTPPTGGGSDTSKPKPKPATTGTVTKGEVRYDTAIQMEGGKNDYGSEAKQSRRANYAYETSSANDRKVLSWDHIREDDATYSHFIWREIDGREKINLPFIYKGRDNSGDQRFFSILLNAIKNDSVVAFSTEDDRFTTPLSYQEVMGKISRIDKSRLDFKVFPNRDNPDVEDTVYTYVENPRAPKPDSVYKFRIKEQVFFDRESSRLLTRIIGIAPLVPQASAAGQNPKASKEPPVYAALFWIYYPDIRASLAKTFAYNPKNVGARMTWEEVFESRYFSSTIIKSTLDNPYDKTLAQMLKDPLFRLLEGENIKEKIFNYEQDLWSY